MSQTTLRSAYVSSSNRKASAILLWTHVLGSLRSGNTEIEGHSLALHFGTAANVDKQAARRTVDSCRSDNRENVCIRCACVIVIGDINEPKTVKYASK